MKWRDWLGLRAREDLRSEADWVDGTGYTRREIEDVADGNAEWLYGLWNTHTQQARRQIGRRYDRDPDVGFERFADMTRDEYERDGGTAPQYDHRNGWLYFGEGDPPDDPDYVEGSDYYRGRW